MSSHAKSIVLLAGSVSILGLGYLLFVPTPRDKAEPVLATQEDEPSSTALATLAPLEVEDSTTDSSRQPATAPTAIIDPSQFASSTAWSAAGGRLRVQAIDSETWRPLERVRVRAMSRTRLADRQSDWGSSELELVLTPDTYSLLVSSDGYEPSEMPPVQVALGDQIALEPVALRAGNAKILGQVTGMRDDLGFRVELLGDGRRPCAECWTEPDEGGSRPSGPGCAWSRKWHCRFCGYAVGSTNVRVTSSGSFTLDRLVSGSYTILLMNQGRQVVGRPTFVQLLADESLHVEMEAAGHRLVQVELMDTDGVSLVTEWARRRERESAEKEKLVERSSEEHFVPPLEFQCRFLDDDLCLAQSVLVLPARELFSDVRPRPFGGRKLGAGPRKPSATDDRVRSSSEQLRPEPRTPIVEPTLINSGVPASGLAGFGPVPTLEVTLEMKSGPFSATVTVPASWEATRVRAQLTRAEPASASADARSSEGAKTFLEYEAIYYREGRR